MTDTPLVPRNGPNWPPLAFDAREYFDFLEECDWTEDQKREFIEALWHIVIGFVDMGLGIHPIQQIQTLESRPAPMLESVHPSISTNNSAPSSTDRKREEEQ